MGHLLSSFFKKHPQTFNIMTALKMIEKNLEKAKDCHKEDKESKKYICYLIKAHKMLEDLMTELEVTPEDYKQTPPEQYN